MGLSAGYARTATTMTLKDAALARISQLSSQLAPAAPRPEARFRPALPRGLAPNHSPLNPLYFLLKAASIRPHHVALKHPERRREWTYEQWCVQSSRLSARFSAQHWRWQGDACRAACTCAASAGDRARRPCACPCAQHAYDCRRATGCTCTPSHRCARQVRFPCHSCSLLELTVGQHTHDAG